MDEKARRGGARDRADSVVSARMRCRRNPAAACGPAGQEPGGRSVRGALLFGYFLLGKQEKVTRLQGCRRNPQDANRFLLNAQNANRQSRTAKDPLPKNYPRTRAPNAAQYNASNHQNNSPHHAE